jgi:WD40 repeat protein
LFAPCGRVFALAGRSTVVAFEAESGKPRVTLSAIQELGRVVFNSDGSRLVMVRRDGFGQYGDTTTADPMPIWDTATGRAVCTLKGFTSPVRDAAFSPDGKRIATSGIPKSTWAGEFRLWDAATGDELLRLPYATGFTNPVRLTFSPDGYRLTMRPVTPEPGREPEQT